MIRIHRDNLQPGLLSLMWEDMRTHREGFFAQGFWALVVYRFSHRRLRCQFRIVRLPWATLNFVLQKLIEMTCGISIPESAEIGRRLNIEHFGGIVIHGNATIGDDCLIRHGVTLGNKVGKCPNDAPYIGNNVEIGAGAKILGAITVGNGAVVGANAVVVRNVPAGAMVGGIPARVLRMRANS